MNMMPPAQANRYDAATAQLTRVIVYLNSCLSEQAAPTPELWEARQLVSIARNQVDGKLKRAC